MSRYPALALLPKLGASVLVASVLVAGGLAACSSAPPATTAQARCQQQVNDDPAVKAILVNAPGMGADPTWREQLAQARRKSVNDCLVAAGLAPPGGVEPVNRARYGLGWY
jgi:hypothetical protein